MKLHLVPITLREASEFVTNFHRHNKAPQGGKFAIGASNGSGLVGVVIVGRPISRHLDTGFTAEALRCCVQEGNPNVCSFLYGAAWRAAKAMGYTKIITYTLAQESGSSLRGVGWSVIAESKSSKEGWMNRPGREWQPVYGQQKFRWETTGVT
jgi:hypothetical protein